MKTLYFSIDINAEPEKVWKNLWESESYKKWSSVFCQGSYFEIDEFKIGNKIHFLTPEGEGMYSVIEDLIENKYLAFKHLGAIKNFKELPLDDPSTTEWSNAIESYVLIAQDGGTHLKINAQTADEYIDFMNETFPKALKVLKQLVEK